VGGSFYSEIQLIMLGGSRRSMQQATISNLSRKREFVLALGNKRQNLTELIEGEAF